MEQLLLVKAHILSCLSHKKEARKACDCEQPDSLVSCILSKLYADLQVGQLGMPMGEISEKFSKFFINCFRVRTLEHKNHETFHLGENFIFLLDGTLQVASLPKKATDCNEPTFRQVFGSWSIVQPTSYSNIRVTASDGGACVLVADRNSYDKFRIQLVKEDRDLKMFFFQAFLFSSKNASFPLNSISIERYKRGAIIPPSENHVALVHTGSVTLHLTTLNSPSFKWKFTLVKGALLNLPSILELVQAPQHDTLYKETYISEECAIILMPMHDFGRALRNDQQAKANIMEKIRQVQASRESIISKTMLAKEVIKEAEEGKLIVSYPIPRGKSSKAFRKRYRSQDSTGYEEFMTFNKYEKTTENKEKVEKRHMMYSQLMEMIRDREKEERMKKKLNSESGLKEIKKNEYNARWKQCRIDHLAIKESIFNTEKYRDRPNDVRFIFQDEQMSEGMKGELLKRRRVIHTYTVSTENDSENTNRKHLSRRDKVKTSVCPDQLSSLSRGMQKKRNSLFLHE